MKKKKPRFNLYEEKILKVLAQGHRPMAIKTVAREAGISFPTAKKYLYLLRKRSLVLLEEEEDA